MPFVVYWITCINCLSWQSWRPCRSPLRSSHTGHNQITVAIDGKPYTTFYYGPEVAKPYLYPLRAPSGVRVTRGYPMDTQPGESLDHPHQRAVWFAHSKVNGIDYWNNEFSYKAAKPRPHLRHQNRQSPERPENRARSMPPRSGSSPMAKSS